MNNLLNQVYSSRGKGGAFNGKHVYVQMPKALQHLEKLSTAPTVRGEKRCFPYLVHSFSSD